MDMLIRVDVIGVTGELGSRNDVMRVREGLGPRDDVKGVRGELGSKDNVIEVRWGLGRMTSLR